MLNGHYTGVRHALAATCLISHVLRSTTFEIITVHAPQPPSPHPNFVPQRRSFSRKYDNSVHSGSGFSSTT